MRSLPVLALVFFLSCLAHAEGLGEQEAVEVSDFNEIFSHALVLHPLVSTAWADVSKDRKEAVWEFALTVDENGRVASAILKSGPIKQQDEATQIAMALRFKPFERDGRAVQVRFSYYVQGKSVDYLGSSDRAFPANPPPERILIALRRTSCFGTCPDYRVEVRGDGEVSYRGDGYVLVTGEHHWHIAQKAIAGLLDLFRRADYFKLKGYYELDASDLPTYVTRIRVGEQQKFVLDYGGGGMGQAMASTSFGGDQPDMPPIVTELEDAVDQVSGVASWVRGDEKTIERLRAAKWNFRSKQAGHALGLLIGDCKTELAREFIREGAPINAKNSGWGRSVAIAEAAQCADIKFVKLLESRGALAQRMAARAFLEASVESGYPDMVTIALKHYANPRIKDREGVPLISTAAGAYDRRDDASGDAKFDSAKVVALLISAGADANARDNEGNTPLREANSDDVARALIKGGADPNARNADGQTPLFDPYFEGPKTALLEAGADVTIRDKFGRTALFEQQRVESANALINAGADVNAKDLAGKTPLESAPHEEVALTLLAAGARLPDDPVRLQNLTKSAAERKWTRLLPMLEHPGTNEGERERKE